MRDSNSLWFAQKAILLLKFNIEYIALTSLWELVLLLTTLPVFVIIVNGIRGFLSWFNVIVMCLFRTTSIQSLLPVLWHKHLSLEYFDWVVLVHWLVLLLIFFSAADFFDDSCENKEVYGKILELKMFNLSTGIAPQCALNAYKSHSLSRRCVRIVCSQLCEKSRSSH
jgi:hypothetical protein